jgi:hypothetical protein
LILVIDSLRRYVANINGFSRLCLCMEPSGSPRGPASAGASNLLSNYYPGCDSIRLFRPLWKSATPPRRRSNLLIQTKTKDLANQAFARPFSLVVLKSIYCRVCLVCQAKVCVPGKSLCARYQISSPGFK